MFNKPVSGVWTSSLLDLIVMTAILNSGDPLEKISSLLLANPLEHLFHIANDYVETVFGFLEILLKFGFLTSMSCDLMISHFWAAGARSCSRLCNSDSISDGFLGSKTARQNCTAVLEDRLVDLARSSSTHAYSSTSLS